MDCDLQRHEGVVVVRGVSDLAATVHQMDTVVLVAVAASTYAGDCTASGDPDVSGRAPALRVSAGYGSHVAVVAVVTIVSALVAHLLRARPSLGEFEAFYSIGGGRSRRGGVSQKAGSCADAGEVRHCRKCSSVACGEYIPKRFSMKHLESNWLHLLTS